MSNFQDNMSACRPTELPADIRRVFSDPAAGLLLLQSVEYFADNESVAQDILQKCNVLRQKGGSDALSLDVVRLYCEYTLLAPKKDPIRMVKGALNGQELLVTVPNIFVISKSEASERIECYLKALAKIGETFSETLKPGSVALMAELLERFLLKLNIEVGFVAPMHLIDGLMSKFDENWGDVIASFEQALRAGSAETDEIRAFRQMQLFTFDCWLLWGPSIPVCRCDRWGKRHPDDFDPEKHLPAYGQQEASLALQFGFGDENNSLPLMSIFNESLGETRSFTVLTRTVQAGMAPAVRHSVTARIISSAAAKHRICDVQKELPGFLLDYIGAEDRSRAEGVANEYYSAYLWAMFVLCKRDKATGRLVPYFDGTQGMMRWQGVLPVFVHGNIADAKTYNVSKAQLAYKALSTLRECVSSNSLMGRQCPVPKDMRFVYTCAFDDPGGCSVELARDCGFEQHDPRSIAGLLYRLMENGQPFDDISPSVLHYCDLGDESLQSRYSACHLPELIEDFYAYVDSVVKERQPNT